MVGQIEIRTDADGQANVPLEPGVYALRVVHGLIDETRTVTVETGPESVNVQVDPGRSRRDGHREDLRRELFRGRFMASTGGVLVAGGILMAIAAGLESNKDPCPPEVPDCSNAPRPSVTTALTAGAVTSVIGGGVLVYAGVRKVRRVRPSLQLSRHSVGMGLMASF